MIGTTISHYKILEKLGEGGMGIVYRAHDTKLNRNVALKFLGENIVTNEAERARLLLEAQAAAVLNHPNICTVHAIEEVNGEPFIVMEFLEGRSLRAVMNDGPLAIPEAVRIATQVSTALQAAHEKGIVHRDVKPENIILMKNGLAKIADFGLARHSELLQVAESGLGSGTIAYMSPEQLQGTQVSHRTDIWSVGVVLFEMLTERRPFAASYRQALIYAILNEKCPSVTALRPGIPSSLGNIVDRCLEKEPELRFPDSAELVSQLRAVSTDSKKALESTTRSIAVLPFTDLSPKKDNRFFSEGLTEEVIANLSKLRNVKVVSRTSIIRYERQEKTMKQIGAELGVQFVLEGSVRKHGENLRITTQLIDAGQDVSLWAETFRGTMEEVFEIQEQVAGRVVRALKVRISPTEKKNLNRRPTKNTDAYQLYLKGRFFWNKRTKDGLEKSIRYFEDAIAKDAKFALAWAGLSDAYNLIGQYGTITRKEIAQKARTAAERALKLDDRLAEAHTSLASLMMMHDWNWKKAEKEFKLAIRLNPGYGTGHHWYSEWLRYTGRMEEALKEISLAVELDPLSPAIAKDKGMTEYYARKYDDAIESAKSSLELEPGFGPAHRLLSMAYQGKGMLAEAIAENERWAKFVTNPHEVPISLAQLHAAGGKREEALRLLESIHPDRITNGNLMRGVALVFASLGDRDQAFRWFDKSYEQQAESLCSVKVDPKLDSLRGDPRFDALLKKIGLDN
ncbi:MAG: protein kinase [Bacteroidota bacterium]